MKVEGSTITINDSVYNKMSIIPKGLCEQKGTPTPDNPIPVKVVTGDNEVVIGGNIFDGIIETGSIYKGNNSVTDNNIRSKNYSEVIGGETYNFYVNGTLNRVAIIAYDTNHSWISDYGSDHGYQTETGIFTVPQNAKYIRFRSYQADYNLFNTGTITIIGAEEIYPIHLGTQYLSGIGDYKDEIVGKTNEWKIKRYVGKVVLDGSENWAFNSQLQNIKNFTITINSLPSITNNDNIIRVVSNKLIGKSASDIINQASTYSIGVISNKRIFVTTDTTFTTSTNDFKTWLDTNNITCWHQLAEPIEEPILDTTLINDLNKLQELLSYNGVTNITVISEDTNAQMEVEVTYTSESDMCEKLLFIFNKMKDKLYHIIRSL